MLFIILIKREGKIEYILFLEIWVLMGEYQIRWENKYVDFSM